MLGGWVPSCVFAFSGQVELWPDSVDENSADDDLPEPGAALDALLQDALRNAEFLANVEGEPRTRAGGENRHHERLMRVGQILLAGRLSSFQSMASAAGCGRRWVPVKSRRTDSPSHS